jgi:fluoride exporter
MRPETSAVRSQAGSHADPHAAARSRPVHRTGRAQRPRRDSLAQLDLLAVIAAGGVLGAEARYGVARLLPHPPAAFPWATLVVNALGCLLIGVLMVVVTELTRPHRLARPFLGVGVLGGFTTFSTYTVDVQRLLLAHRPGMALGYLLGTLAAALVTVWLGATATRALVVLAGRRRARGTSHGTSRETARGPARGSRRPRS